MLSFRKTTGVILLEVLASCVLAITVDKLCGHMLLDENVSWVYDKYKCNES